MKDLKRLWREQQARMKLKAEGLDPTDTFTVGAGSDDIWILRGVPMYDLDSEEIACGDITLTDSDYEAGMRWTVDIPQGAIINSAYLKLVALDVYGVIPTTIIEGEDADDPATFSNWVDYDGRTRTSQSVNWTPPAWTEGTIYTSGDISSIIQAIVNRVGFGTHIVLFWSHALGFDGFKQLLGASAYEHPTYDPPKLEVTWEGEAPPVKPKGTIAVHAKVAGII